MKYFNLVQTASTYSWVFLPILGYLVAFFIVEIFFKSNRFWLKAWNHKFNWLNRLDFNIFISLVCVSYFVLIKYLNHLSFQTSAFDFAIFDQNFFVQSQGIFPPINSVREMSNLWIDHQHFSSNQFLRHPWFHYGSEIPTIVIFGIIFTYFLFIKYNKKQLAQKFIYFILISYIFGFISIIGWSSNIDTQRVNNYSFFSLKNAKLGYLTTSDERQDLNYVKQFIKPNYKLRTSREYMPQFSARLNLSYLYGIDTPEGLEKMKSDEYDYWLIPKKAEQDKIYIKSLKQNNLKIIVETSNQILFKTN